MNRSDELVGASTASFSDSARGDGRLAEALKDYLAELEAGRNPDRQAFEAKYPELVDQLDDCLVGLEFIQKAASGFLATNEQPVPPAVAEIRPGSVVGDFRVVRLVGRGGMGVVYEAEQVSLSRKVALKVLPRAAALDPVQLQRFKNEAQAAAHLHHQNIVPVHAVGCEGDVYYYAMQFIEGQTLAGVIQDLRQMNSSDKDGPPTAHASAVTQNVVSRDTPLPPSLTTGDRTDVEENADPEPPAPSSEDMTPSKRLNDTLAVPRPGDPSTHSRRFFRTVAQLGAQAAEGLEHAHSVGIVHRDIKPANLLLDERGNLWITDFGLAHVHGDTQLTMTGDIVGTLRYMSPEQALAQRGMLDQRTDIYSLGVTLYELLTLEPAFDGSDRQELLRQIAFEEPKPPRRWNRAVPVDLETILLKAMAKEPPGRYATAQEMADDLRRFLADEPVRARRPTMVQKTAKWCRRHRALVATAVLVGVAGLMVSTAVFWYGQGQTEVQRRVAIEKLDLAQRAVDEMYIRAHKILDKEWVAGGQTELLDKALIFYLDFSQEPGADIGMRFRRAKALQRIGEIQTLRRQHAEAEAAASRAAEQMQQLAAEVPSTTIFQRELAECHLVRARALHAADSLKGIHSPRCEQAYGSGISSLERLIDRFPDQPEYQFALAKSCYELSTLLMEAARPEQAEFAFVRARDLLQKVAESDPSNTDYRNYLAAVYSGRGLFFAETKKFADAESSFRMAVKILDELAQGFKVLPELRHQQGETYSAFAALLAQQNKSSEAETFYRKAVTVYQELVVSHSGVARYHASLATALDGLGHQLHGRGDLRGALERHEQAVQHGNAARQASPENFGYRFALQTLYRDLGWTLLDLGDYRAAAAAAVWASDIVPGCPAGANIAALLYARCVDQVQFDPKLSPAELKSLKDDYTQRFRRLSDLIITNGREYSELVNDVAWLLATFPDERARDPKRAVKLADQLVKRYPQDPRIGLFWNTLGVARYRTGDWKGAVAALEKSAKMNKGKEPQDGLFLAMAYIRLGEREKAKRWYVSAIQLLEKRAPTEEERRFRAEAATLLLSPGSIG
jgi:eukaryotic-like serine/threonine-protein kinase